VNFDKRSTIQVTTFPGLSELLAGELRALGFDIASTHATGVETAGTLADCMKMNLHLRTALNVLFEVGAFTATSADELYRETRKIEWEGIISPDEYLSVTSRVDTPSIDNTMFPNLRVKDAVVDRIASKTGRRPDSGPERGNVVIQLNWHGEDAWLFLNTSGVKLSDRGYRRIPHRAPLREVLAAGIVMATEYNGETPLVLPMCGSGTLAVEAALLALARAPGLLRHNYAFTHLVGFDRDRWEDMRADAKRSRAKHLGAPIIATDVDPAAVTAARKNSASAAVDHLIEFKVCDFAETPVPDGPGILIVNPEYGKRLGEIRALEATYKRLGDFFKQQCAGYSAYIFTGNMDLAKKVGLRASRRVPFWNAKIECRLLKYDIYEGTKRTKEPE
jgi:putative N6-adenine-specific DNA methylase